MPNTKLELLKKANAILENSMRECAICPRMCRADRAGGAKGYCRAGLLPKVYSYMKHRGEEPPISGTRGSGTIFFSHCNMKCVYCQNYNFSQLDKGEEVGVERLAEMMKELQDSGCHNVNLVSPTHYIPQILSSLEIAVRNGLTIPVVYNTSGYELSETIRMLEGIVDIYLPDMRYSDNSMAVKYSDAPGYAELNRAAVLEMHRQTGRLIMNAEGLATNGLLTRLLSLPSNISGTCATLRYIRDNIGKDTYLSIMSQYYPTFKAAQYHELSRGVSPAEYDIVVDEARFLGLNNGWIQEAPEDFDPKFFGTNIPPKR